MHVLLTCSCLLFLFRVALDVTGLQSLVAEKFVKKLCVKNSNQMSTVWSTPAGKMTTKHRVKAQFTLPELHDDKLIEWNLHITKDLGVYDMIIRWDVLEFLNIDIQFSTQTVEWGTASMPFKAHDVMPHDAQNDVFLFWLEPSVVHVSMTEHSELIVGAAMA